ncbi:MAG: sporulation initiation factor Spo0A C-terminal domain-containing protein, partial [Clostridiales bacterium]|nr:sporulation initiation factor Spo0A C-terminal domain-containing protein [Clostridiales bacterium]
FIIIYDSVFVYFFSIAPKGFKYLLIGINYCMHDSRYINSLSKALYPRIAKTVGTGESSAARLINEALKTADRGKNKELWEKVTGSAERKFTVAEFLTAVCNYIEHGETGEV